MQEEALIFLTSHHGIANIWERQVGRLLKVGLTGGIACGKSMVSAMLAHKGAKIIDADLLAREAVAPGKPAWQEIRQWLDDSYFLDDGMLDRRRIGTLVFSSAAARDKLNAIVHPRVIALFQQYSQYIWQKEKGALQIWDVPLLIEVGMDSYVDRILVVAAREKVQVERLCRRDGLTEAQALQRIRSQMPVADKIRVADWVIYNNGTEEELRLQVDQFWEKINAIAHGAADR